MRKPVANKLIMDGEKLKARLVRRNLTLTDAASAVGVPYRKAQFWPVGGEIDPVHLYHLAKLLRCKMADLLHDDFQREGV